MEDLNGWTDGRIRIGIRSRGRTAQHHLGGGDDEDSVVFTYWYGDHDDHDIDCCHEGIVNKKCGLSERYRRGRDSET